MKKTPGSPEKPGNEKIPTKCPHCGVKLSAWEQVILSVDRMLMCKNCWYRIVLDAFSKDKNNDDKTKEKR